MESSMKTGNKFARFTKLRRNEEGAEAVEFALLAPVLFFLVFGILYVLVLFAAQLSLGYATNVAVRYAAIPTAGSTYPTAPQVLTRALNSTPFFGTSSCSPNLAAAGTNAPVTFTMNCDFPNPAAGFVNGLRQTFFGGGSDIQSTVELSATARSRKE
jgi:Flp pilus assembly protein TadG